MNAEPDAVVLPQMLQQRRVLVAEDQYILARDLSLALAQEGARVLGPAPTLARAIALIRSEPLIDGAILDVNLRGELVYEAADMLRARGVPFLFTTGYGASSIPARFKGIVRCEKPAHLEEILTSFAGLLQA